MSCSRAARRSLRESNQTWIRCILGKTGVLSLIETSRQRMADRALFIDFTACYDRNLRTVLQRLRQDRYQPFAEIRIITTDQR